jgi:hypothetical protein
MLMIPGCRRDSEEELDILNISNTPGLSLNPAIAVDSRGTFYVVWEDWLPVPESLFILMASRPPGGEWSVPERVLEMRCGQFPDIEIDKHNTIHLIWRNTDQELWGEVLYTKKPVAGTWTEPETLSIYGRSCSPDMTVDDNGNVHLIWQELIDDWPVFYSKKKASGYWTWPIEISRTADWRTDIQIDVGPKGGAHVVWINMYEYGESSPIKSAPVYTTNVVGDTWSYPEKLYKDWLLETHCPSIVVDNAEVIHVVWASHGDIFYTHKSPGSEWETPARICSTNTISGSPDLTEDIDGTLYLVWREGGHNLCYTSKSLGDDWENIHTYVLHEQAFLVPQLAISENSIGIVYSDILEYYSNGATNDEVFFTEIPLY